MPTISTYALNSRDCCPLLTRTSTAPLIVSTNKNLDRAELRKHDTCFVHIVNVLLYNVRTPQNLSNDFEPVQHLLRNIVSIPVQRLGCAGFEL